MKQHAVIEVGMGQTGPPSIEGGGHFQKGADWMFAQVRQGRRVRMRYTGYGRPAYSDYVVISLDDEDLETLGLIEDRLSVEDVSTPWEHDYADAIREFLFAHADSLMRFIREKTGDTPPGLDDHEDDKPQGLELWV